MDVEQLVDAYLRARAAEGRLLDDAIVAALPDVPPGHALAAEWRARAVSARRLAGHLRRSGSNRVVELGCGNGWLAARLARLPGVDVTGVDVNGFELDQARRVFADVAPLAFVHGDLREVGPELVRGATVVLASALQYVGDAGAVLRDLVGAGALEVHVVDTPWYAAGEVGAARERSAAHYASIGAPEMAAHYVHHTWAELDGLRVDVLARPPGRVRARCAALVHAAVNPFPWLRVTP